MKKIYICSFLLLMLLIIGCSQTSQKRAGDKKEALPVNLPIGDTFVVSGKGMLFLRPDKVVVDSAIEKIKQEQGNDTLVEIASDEGLYTGQASEYGQKRGLKQYYSSAKNILFIKENQGRFFIKNNLNGISGEIYLFDGIKDPKKVENIATFSNGKEYEAYFGQ